MRERDKATTSDPSAAATAARSTQPGPPWRSNGGDAHDPIADSTLLDACRSVMVADPALVGCLIGTETAADRARRQVLGTEGIDGRIAIEVKGGVVFLDGEVTSLSHKRLAGVLALRQTACRAVVNRLLVELPSEDSDDERTTAVRLALCRDSAIDARTIRVRVQESVAMLEGTVESPMQALAAEADAAGVLGIERVENRLVVEPPILGKA